MRKGGRRRGMAIRQMSERGIERIVTSCSNAAELSFGRKRKVTKESSLKAYPFVAINGEKVTRHRIDIGRSPQPGLITGSRFLNLDHIST